MATIARPPSHGSSTRKIYFMMQCTRMKIFAAASRRKKDHSG
jgi:hypothetical protein